MTVPLPSTYPNSHPPPVPAPLALHCMQAMSLGVFPKLRVVHTNSYIEGQIFIPFVNYTLMLLCIAIIAGFGGDNNRLGEAYGEASLYFPLPGLFCFCMSPPARGWGNIDIDWDLEMKTTGWQRRMVRPNCLCAFVCFICLLQCVLLFKGLLHVSLAEALLGRGRSTFKGSRRRQQQAGRGV